MPRQRAPLQRARAHLATGGIAALVTSAALGLLVTACGSSTRHAVPATSAAPAGSAARGVPPTTAGSGGGTARPAHIVVVVEENHAAKAILGNADAPYLNGLARRGTTLTRSFATTHPSQPNYLELFSGSTQGVGDDRCPPPHSPYAAANLASTLAASGRSFAGYSEDLPSTGSTVCDSGGYARKHNPWSDFADVPASANLTLASLPRDFAALPDVSFVIPNLQHDMHDGTVAMADSWLQAHLGGYVTWASTHDSLLVVTWDEDDHTAENHILTMFVGQKVKPGATVARRVTHDDVLRTIEDLEGAKPVGASAQAHAVTDIWAG